MSGMISDRQITKIEEHVVRATKKIRAQRKVNVTIDGKQILQNRVPLILFNFKLTNNEVRSMDQLVERQMK